jgi:hypothetical protein
LCQQPEAQNISVSGLSLFLLSLLVSMRLSICFVTDSRMLSLLFPHSKTIHTRDRFIYSFAQGENMVSTFGLFKFQVINLVSKINRLYLEDMIIHNSLLLASLGTLINSCSPISRSFTI